MNEISIQPRAAEGRARHLKAETNATHDRLDKRIMAARPFADRARYACFLQVQSLFHRDIEALYSDPALGVVVPDLAGRRRLPLILQDLHDMGEVEPQADRAPAFAAGDVDIASALGWLYVAEGSNLGAAFLFKAAASLGLDGGFGARHLAGHPDGRAQHWRSFTAALDSLELTPEEEQRVIAGAQAAFIRVHNLVEAILV